MQNCTKQSSTNEIIVYYCYSVIYHFRSILLDLDWFIGGFSDGAGRCAPPPKKKRKNTSTPSAKISNEHL